MAALNVALGGVGRWWAVGPWCWHLLALVGVWQGQHGMRLLQLALVAGEKTTAGEGWASMGAD